MANSEKKKIVTVESILLVALVCWALTGCKEDSSQSKENPIKWDSIAYHKITPLDNKDNSPRVIEQDYLLLLPLDNPPLEREICRVILGDTMGSLEPSVLLDSLARVNRQHDIIKGTQGEGISYNERLTSSLAYIDNKLVSLAVRYSFSIMGNKEHSSLCYYRFSLPEGKAFCESSLFVDGYELPLSNLLIQKIESLSEGEIINYDEIRPNGNFLVTTKGITYCFPEYTIVGNHKGELSVPLSWQELRLLLKEKSPIHHLFS